MVPKKSRFCPKVPNFAFVASFRAKSQIRNPVSERLIMLLGTIKPHASPVNCIKCTVSLSDCSPTKGTIFKFLNFVIFGYKQKLEFLPYNECFRKGPQLRTWSSWGPNCWNGPHWSSFYTKVLSFLWRGSLITVAGWAHGVIDLWYSRKQYNQCMHYHILYIIKYVHACTIIYYILLNMNICTFVAKWVMSWICVF